MYRVYGYNDYSKWRTFLLLSHRKYNPWYKTVLSFIWQWYFLGFTCVDLEGRANNKAEELVTCVSVQESILWRHGMYLITTQRKPFSVLLWFSGCCLYLRAFNKSHEFTPGGSCFGWEKQRKSGGTFSNNYSFGSYKASGDWKQNFAFQARTDIYCLVV